MTPKLITVSEEATLLHNLTPVILEAGLHVKRDDLFALEAKAPIRGGKLRQCIAMLDGATISRLISAGSIHSPQPAIVAYVARHLGLPCTILVGGKHETPSLIMARDFGAEILRCRSGRHTVLFDAARRVAGHGDFIVPFGMRPERPYRAFYETCAAQVSNIPPDVETTVIASGSGVTATIIAFGMWMERRADQRIALINVGPDRHRQILETLWALSPSSAKWAEREIAFQIYPLGQQPGFRYEAPTSFSLGKIVLNPLYEAKAFAWFTRQVSFDACRTLFWVTGPPLGYSQLRAGAI